MPFKHRQPEMQMRYDENSIPVSAKCSICGEKMPQSGSRTNSTIENVEWFTSQFNLHVLQNHPSTDAPKPNPAVTSTKS
jgi:hypothetical protein